MRGLFLRRVYPKIVKELTITVTGKGCSGCFLTMPDGTVVKAAGTYTVLQGEKIRCTTYRTDASGSVAIKHNGAGVGSGEGWNDAPFVYDFYPAKNATIALAYTTSYNGQAIKTATITITEG